KTRHNAAWMLLQQLEKKEAFQWQKKFKGSFAKSDTTGTVFLKPEVFMNLAGESVAPALSFFKFLPKNLIVCHDDIELGFGTVALKFGGGSAGHNGLRSISNLLGTNDFWRFRIGISRPVVGKVDAHVLGKFSPDEEAVLPVYMEKAAAYLETFLCNPGNPALTAKASEGAKTKLL
ncbi:MAG: aminoacyl-tRNA hydrolase, partial [Spirochaetes bacterium]|nr:aminoacyl-tRNA hydrolase [Spirochaetota bacterium]